VQGDDTGKPNQNDPDKLQQMADEAVAAGKRALDTETGKQIADIADAGFTTAGKLVDGLLDNPTGAQMKQGASDLLAKTGPVGQSDAGRNMIAGAAIGFFIGLVFSFIGLFWGTMIGAALGFLRTITKKP
jgi:ABC-type dipeptide/oligopeptide/nickel transport system permease subunit